MAEAKWEKCAGKNKDGRCRNQRHLTHKESWGSWYGQLPIRPATELQKDNRPPKKRKKKRWWE